jgi:hypothetical protein
MSNESTEPKNATGVEPQILPESSDDAHTNAVDNPTDDNEINSLGETSHYVTGTSKVRKCENPASAAKRQRLLEKKTDTWVCFLKHKYKVISNKILTLLIIYNS